MRSPLAVGWAAASHHGLTAFNQLAACTELGRSQELLQTGNTRYIDISNIGVITILKNAVDEIARRPEVDEIMLDDNFGVISKTSKKVNPVTGEEVFFLETDYKRLFSDDGSMRFVTEKITDSLKTIKNQIDMVNQNTGKDVKLSMSVQPFTFEPKAELNRSVEDVLRDPNFNDGALEVNGHDVYDWIQRELITGTLNVQMYRSNFRDFETTFNNFANSLNAALGTSIASKIPKISISVGHEGSGWARDIADLQQDINHVRQSSLFQQGIISEVALFDYLDSQNLAQGHLELGPDQKDLVPVPNSKTYLGAL